jgi:H/ACA ribonucleoprotein complex non-core subunit NAF1
MAEFKVPDSMPQDLLLIQEMVGVLKLPKQDPTTKTDEDESSSSSESDISSSDGEDEKEQGADSEDEIEAKLVNVGEGDSDPSSEKSPYVMVFSIPFPHSSNQSSTVALKL